MNHSCSLTDGVSDCRISHSRVRDPVGDGVISHSCKVRCGVSDGVISHSCRVRGGVRGSGISHS